MTGAFTTQTAHAQYGVCVGDPTFVLSNGYRLEATVTASGGPAVKHALKQVRYRIQVPAGVTVLSVAQSTSSPSVRQSWTLAHDPVGSGSYSTSATVAESPAQFPVVLTQSVADPTTGASVLAVASGGPAKSITLTAVASQGS
jgi:hypothetical protein